MKDKTDGARELIYNQTMLIRKRLKNSQSLSSLSIKYINLKTMTYRKPTVKTLVLLQYRPLKTVTKLPFITFNNSFKFMVYRLKSIKFL